jgi:hypothetical protein
LVGWLSIGFFILIFTLSSNVFTTNPCFVLKCFFQCNYTIALEVWNHTLLQPCSLIENFRTNYFNSFSLISPIEISFSFMEISSTWKLVSTFYKVCYQNTIEKMEKKYVFSSCQILLCVLSIHYYYCCCYYSNKFERCKQGNQLQTFTNLMYNHFFLKWCIM